MNRALRNTTLYLRGVPKDLVRSLKAQAVLKGTTLTAYVVEALSRIAGENGREELEALKPLEPDMTWYEAHKPRLLRRYRGEHLAILNSRVIDHDKDFDALARRVFAKIGVRSIFMPLCVDPEPVIRIHSPRVVRP